MEDRPPARVSNEVLVERVDNLKEIVTKGFQDADKRAELVKAELAVQLSDTKLKLAEIQSDIHRIDSVAAAANTNLSMHLRDVELTDEPRLENVELHTSGLEAKFENFKILQEEKLNDHLRNHSEGLISTNAQWKILSTVDRIVLRIMAGIGGVLSIILGLKAIGAI